MPGNSVGQIGLDLVVNRNGFDRQMAGIQGLAKKAGLALAAAFSIKKLANFGAACISLGSDLEEVQNVVDTVFPQMNKQLEGFAKNAAAQFGLSETMAKQYSGMYGAMAKAFGFSESAAYDMSTALTGLAGDVASFYNIDQDVAYTKLKSVFSGETETLKDLGIVMTQSALDAYAMANGFGKTTKSMSEMEKVALRYAFVQDSLSAAQGDFARTSDSWANQVKLLRLQFDSLKATIGQGLMNVLTPVIKVINTIIGKLMSLANTFKAFTEMVTGKKGGSGSASAAAAAVGDIAGAADSASGSLDGTGSAAKKAAKDIKGATTGLDELNVISPNDSSGGSGGSGGAAGIGSAADFGGLTDIDVVDPVDAGAEALFRYWNTAKDIFESVKQKSLEMFGIVKPIALEVIEDLRRRVLELANLFTQGFGEGLGTGFMASLGRIRDSIVSISREMLGMLMDPAILAASENMGDSVALALGRVAGSAASIGLSVAENLIGGLALFLEQNAPFIKDRIVGCIDAKAAIIEKAGELSVAVASIFEVLRGDTAKQITADLVGIIANAVAGKKELVLRLVRDVFSTLADPIIENKDKIAQALEGTLSPVSEILSTLNGAVKDTFEQIFAAYDNYLKPAFGNIKDGLSSTLEAILDAYNTYVAPVLQAMAEKFTEVWQGSIQPFIGKLADGVGKAIELLSVLWKNVLSPLINWLVETLVPVIVPILKTIWDTIMNVVAGIAKALGGVVDVIGGVIDFIIGVFTGNWERCWEGIKGIFEGFCSIITGLVTGLWDAISGIFTAAIQIVSGIVQTIWKTVSGIFTTSINAVCGFVRTMWEMVVGIFTNAGDNLRWLIDTIWTNIVAVFTSFINGVISIFTAFWNHLKGTASAIFNAIKDVITTVWDNIRQNFELVIETIRNFVADKFALIRNTITDIITAVKDKVTEIWDAIKQVFYNVIEAIKTNVANKVKAIKDTFISTFEAVRDRVTSIFKGIWDGIKGVINSILGGVEKMANGVINAINSMIRAINGLSFDIPDWVPVIGGNSLGFNIPTLKNVAIPRLAQGGYVKANTPQLAMIGDNRHQGEIVAPEDKLEEMARRAAEMANTRTDDSHYLATMVELLRRIIELAENFDMVVNIDIREIRRKLKDLESRSGYGFA